MVAPRLGLSGGRLVAAKGKEAIAPCPIQGSNSTNEHAGLLLPTLLATTTCVLRSQLIYHAIHLGPPSPGRLPRGQCLCQPP